MTHLLDLDLLDGGEPMPPLVGPARVLVWAGDDVLGEVVLPWLDPLDADALRAGLADRFRTDLVALEHISAASPPTGLAADQVSVVVCTRDRTAHLARCLDHLLALNPAPAEILVVDNAPTTAATAALARARDVRRVVEPRPGLDRARQRGWQSAVGSIVAYVDDDARAHPRFAGAVTGAFSHEEIGAVTGLVLPAELQTPAQHAFEADGGMRKGFERRLFHQQADPVGLQAYRLGVGTNMAYRRSVLERLGGFDPALDVGTETRGGGDLDMLLRVIEAGLVVAYEPSAVVRHVHRRGERELIRQMRDNGVAYAALLAQRRAEAASEPARLAAVRREWWRWHLRRHLRAPLGAVRRGELGRLRRLLAEALGSTQGSRALARERQRS